MADQGIDLSAGLVPTPSASGSSPASQSGGSATQAIDLSAGMVPKKADDTGVMSGLKRVGSGLLHFPGNVYDAFTKPPQDQTEQLASVMPVNGVQLPPSIALGIHRMVVAPMLAQSQEADAYQKKATGNAPAKVQGGVALNMGSTPEEEAQHLANMHRIASMFPLAGPIAGDLIDRYTGSGKYEGQPDKSGAATELLADIAGPKVLEKAGGAAVSGVNKALDSTLPPVAERMYQSALKPVPSTPRPQVTSMVQTGLDSGIPVSPGGAAKLQTLISDLNDRISDQIKALNAGGATVNKFKVASRLSDTAKRFATQVNPESDLAAISDAGNEFVRNQPGAIPVEDAQALKQGTYQQVKGKSYGELRSATIEAQKSLARGLKEEIETQFPEIKGLNAQEGKLINLDGALERSLNRINNHDLMSLGGKIATGAVATAVGGATGSVAHATEGAAGALILHHIMTDPVLQSKLAIALNKAGRGGIPIAVAKARVLGYVNALAQSVQSSQDQSEDNAGGNASTVTSGAQP